MRVEITLESVVSLSSLVTNNTEKFNPEHFRYACFGLLDFGLLQIEETLAIILLPALLYTKNIKHGQIPIQTE